VDLIIMPNILAICRLNSTEPIPDWATRRDLYAVTRTPDELSIVCPQDDVPSGIQCERDWRALKVAGPLDFALTGILASLAAPLAADEISLFALSTFDTDYLLVKVDVLERAIESLHAAGHRVAADQDTGEGKSG